MIAEVVRAAFVGHPHEVASFVERIRESDQSIPELALVAEDSSGVIAHVMLSWVGVEGASRPGILNLTPMSVRPDRQRIGVGAQLIRDALGRAEEAGEPAVMVGVFPRTILASASSGRARSASSPRIRRSPTRPSWSSGSGDTAPTSPVGSSIRLRSTLSGTNDRPEKRSAATRKTPDDVRLDRPGQRWVSDGLSVSTAYGCTVRFDERGVVT